MKFSRNVTAVALLVLALALAAPATAQVGQWSPTNPAWVDLNGDGVVDAGERTLYPEAIFDPNASPPDDLYIVLRGNPWDACPGHLETRINATPLLNPTTISRRRGDVTQTVTGTLPTFSFTESVFFIPPPPIVGTVPKKARVLDQATTATGAGTLIDSAPGDGVYEGLSVGGSNGGGGVPTTSMSFIYRDVNGDGKADYVSFPWALTGVLGVKTSNDCVGGAGGAPQIWIPVDDSNGDGTPDRVTVRFPDPRTPGAVGGLDSPPINAQAASAFGIPLASTAGLVAFAAALVLSGLKLLRGALVTS